MIVPELSVSVIPDGARELIEFREQVYGTFPRRGDALFAATDALLCASDRINALAQLSLQPVFGRGHGAVYAALSSGLIDADRFEDVLSAHRPHGWPLWFALDVTPWERPYAHTSEQRGWVHHPMRHTNGQPFVPGWQYQWLVQLDTARTSWTAPLQARRVPPLSDVTALAADQIRDTVRRLGVTEQVPLFVCDAGYDPAALTWLLWHDQPPVTPPPTIPLRASVLVRVRAGRVFARRPGPRRPGQRGTIARHGARFACHDATTWGAADTTYNTHDAQYGQVSVQAWHHLHPVLSGNSSGGRYRHLPRYPIVEGSIIRVTISDPPRRNGTQNTHELWLWHATTPEQPLDLDACWRAYLRRFDIEHTFKFAKRHLGWLAPALRHPEQADRWTHLILNAITQLRLAKRTAITARLPWQPPQQPHQLTPGRVRTGFPTLRAMIGTPANPRRNTRPGPGRPKGPATTRAPRHPVIKKPRKR